MPDDGHGVARKIWAYANVLYDDGVNSRDYVEQITCLMFLKMEDERVERLGEKSVIPEEHNWKTFRDLDGDDLEIKYQHVLEALGKQPGVVGIIYRKAQNHIKQPAKLKQLVEMIDKETWLGLDVDVLGKVYEEILQENAADGKSGAGQYFTPRPLIQAIVECVRPEPGEKINDPCCGTGGFLQVAYRYVADHHNLDPEQKRFLNEEAVSGHDVDERTARLCAMNLFLHGISVEDATIGSGVDALLSDPGGRYDYVLTNPPFGKKSSTKFVTETGDIGKDDTAYERDDFWVSTKNKQLNFVQHVKTLLKENGLAAMVVPDNVLFEGGAAETVRRNLLKQYEVHTLLRLPTGIFYAGGVKANVLFFEARPAQKEAWTEKLWIYDLRTNQHFTQVQNRMTLEHLRDFIDCYNPKNRRKRSESERFKCFSYEGLLERDKLSLDIFWIKDESLEDSADLPDPDILAGEIAEDLQAALEQIQSIAEELSSRGESIS